MSLPAHKMKALQIVCLFVVYLPFSHMSSRMQSLPQFRTMIQCMLPHREPILDFADYGCYCGYGGSGTPVDDLDRCCQVHDNCYGYAQQHPACIHFWESPYFKVYSFRTDKREKVITCEDEADACARFICECDRRAAECFAKSPWIPEHQHLPSDRCK